MIKTLFYIIEDLIWNLKCIYKLWLHGPYGLSKTIEKMPFRFIIKYLRKYGATIGENCRFETGLMIHRPFGKKPFEKLFIGNNVYLGHNFLIDLSNKITIKDNVIIASNCQFWTHASYYLQTSKHIKPEYKEKCAEITVDEYSVIYSNVVIMHGVNIGKYATIGASSFVNRNVLENSFVAGVPARVIYDNSLSMQLKNN